MKKLFAVLISAPLLLIGVGTIAQAEYIGYEEPIYYSGDEKITEPQTGEMISTEIVCEYNGEKDSAEATLTVMLIEKDTCRIVDKASDSRLIPANNRVSLKAGIPVSNLVGFEYTYFLWNNENEKVPLVNCSPTIPQSVNCETKVGANVLSWEKSEDDYEVEGYLILRDGEEYAYTTKDSYIDYNIISGTDYSYSVCARDGMGLCSDESNAVQVNAVSGGEIVFGEQITQNKFKFYTNPNADSASTQVVYKGRNCIYGNKRMLYFQMDTSYITQQDKELVLTITYFDDGHDPIYMDYLVEPSDSAWIKTEQICLREDTKQWVTKSYKINDAYFHNNDSRLQKCSFRIRGSGAVLYLSNVSLVKAEEYIDGPAYAELGEYIGVYNMSVNQIENGYSLSVKNGYIASSDNNVTFIIEYTDSADNIKLCYRSIGGTMKELPVETDSSGRSCVKVSDAEIRVDDDIKIYGSSVLKVMVGNS